MTDEAKGNEATEVSSKGSNNKSPMTENIAPKNDPAVNHSLVDESLDETDVEEDNGGDDDNNSEKNNIVQNSDDQNQSNQSEHDEEEGSSSDDMQEDVAKDANDKDANSNERNNNLSDDDIDLTKPLKKGRTAYFIFQQENRSDVMKELSSYNNTSSNKDDDKSDQGKNDDSSNAPKVSVAMVAKRVGELWSNLSNDEKKVYHEKSRKEKEIYQKHHNALVKAGISPSSMLTTSANSLSTGNESKNEKKKNVNSDMIFPLARIRKICRLDPEVKGMSKESSLLVTKCCEYFVTKMANDTWSMAKMHQKRTIHAQDVLDVCSLKEMFFFLREDMKDLIQEQKEDKKRKRELKKGFGGEAESSSGDLRQSKISKGMNMSGVKPLTSYFTTQHSSSK